MRKLGYIIFLLFAFTILCNAQPGQPVEVGFKSQIKTRIFAGVSDDTVGSITTPDSVYIQFYNSSTEWQLLTSVISDGDTAMVTADDKIAENSLIFMLSRESFWTHSPQVRFQFRNTGQDTCTSNWIGVGRIDGACSLNVQADTVGTYVDYGGTVLSGN